MKTALITMLGLLGPFCIAEAVVTGWTNPAIDSISGSGTATPSIPENTTSGSTGVTIAATGNGAKIYAIVSQTTEGKLTINATTGVLYLAAGNSFDYETATTYNLQITCVIAAATSTGTATVILNIANVDEKPIFASAQYTATIADGAKEGTALITVKATSYFTGRDISHSITGGNTNTDFTIDENTGAIEVANDKTLNRTVTSKYTLEVTARDGTHTATTTVLATVTALNSGTTFILGSAMMIIFAIVTYAM